MKTLYPEISIQKSVEDTAVASASKHGTNGEMDKECCIVRWSNFGINAGQVEA